MHYIEEITWANTLAFGGSCRGSWPLSRALSLCSAAAATLPKNLPMAAQMNCSHSTLLTGNVFERWRISQDTKSSFHLVLRAALLPTLGQKELGEPWRLPDKPTLTSARLAPARLAGKAANATEISLATHGIPQVRPFPPLSQWLWNCQSHASESEVI